jgi:uncharacterized protein (DUF1810 family)
MNRRQMLLGMGFREVIRYRKTDEIVTETLNEGTEHEHTYSYPKMEAYKGSPTVKNYAVITLTGL